MEIYVSGQKIVREVNNNAERWYFSPGREWLAPDTTPFDGNDVTLMLGFWDIAQFELSLHGELEWSAQRLLDWQTLVFNKVSSIERKRIDDLNREKQLVYDTAMSTYRNRLAELRATAVNELLQGRSEAANRAMILMELKRGCLAVLAKEFDTDAADDLLTDWETMGTRPVQIRQTRMKVEEAPGGTTAAFVTTPRPGTYPAINLVAKLPQSFLPNLALVRAARRVIALMVASSLVELENHAVNFARHSWQDSKEKLNGWARAFTVTIVNREQPRLSDRGLADNLLAACRRYGSLRARILKLQEDIDTRNRKRPPSRRPAGSGYALWFEVYAKPQRDLLHEMANELAHITALFPAAILILDDLPSEIYDDASVVRVAIASTELEERIYTRIKVLIQGIEQLVESLTSAPVTAPTATMLQSLVISDPLSITRVNLPSDGFESEALGAVLKRTEDKEQRILADLQLLIALLLMTPS